MEHNKTIQMTLKDRIKALTIKINFVSLYKFIKKYFMRKKTTPYALGAIKDKEDPRDIIYRVRRYKGLPESTNKRNIKKFRTRYNQGALGSCVGHGVVEAYRYVLKTNNQSDFLASRLFAYYIAREDKDNDTGASIRDAFKAVNKYGLCSEKTIPYCIKKFASKPSDEAFKEALDHQSIRYERLPHTKEAIKDAVSRGYPVVYGKLIYDSFMSDEVARTGIIPLPDKTREQMHGGHCMVIFDYDKDGVIELNSWGSGWGMCGTCHVPWEFVLDRTLCMDFWTFYIVEGESINNNNNQKQKK